MADLPKIGNYELHERIGQGGMGTVFRARQMTMDRTVAVKILPPALAKQPLFIERFMREAKASARLNHPNIVNGIDVGKDEDTGLYYFAMEYIEGLSVKYILAQKERFSELQAAKIGKAIAQALAHAHAHGILHRDVKPDNILIDKSGTPKLCDLGLVRLDADGDATKGLTQQGFAVGTPHYISPEQARGAQDLDAATDLYSLGATLYHMLTGRTVFDGPTSVVVMTKHITEKCAHPNSFGGHDPDLQTTGNRVMSPEISKGMVQVLAKLLAKERTARYASAKLLAEDLDRVAQGKPPRHAELAPGHWPFMAETAPGKKSAVASVQEKFHQPHQPGFAPLTSVLSPRGKWESFVPQASRLHERSPSGGLRWYVWAGVAVLALALAGAYFGYGGKRFRALLSNGTAPAMPAPAKAQTSALPPAPGQASRLPDKTARTPLPSWLTRSDAIGPRKPESPGKPAAPKAGETPAVHTPAKTEPAFDIKAKPAETHLPSATTPAPEDLSKVTPGSELANLISRALLLSGESKFREAAEVFKLPDDKLSKLDKSDRELAKLHADGYSGLAELKTQIIERLKGDPNKFDATTVLAKLPGGKLAGGDDRALLIKGPDFELPYLWSKLTLEDVYTLGSLVLAPLPAGGSLGVAVLSYDQNTERDDAFARKVLSHQASPNARRVLELIDLREKLAVAKKQAVENAFAEKLFFELDLAMMQGDAAAVYAKAGQLRAKYADTELMKARSGDLAAYCDNAKLAKQLGAVTQPGNVALASNGATVAPLAGQLIDGNITNYDSNLGFATLTWPDKWVVTLPKVYLLHEIRILLWDVDAERFYRYQVETSCDGKQYGMLSDHSKGEWRSWQVLKFTPQPVKFIRLMGTYSSANTTFHVVELEAYCIPPETPPVQRKAKSQK